MRLLFILPIGPMALAAEPAPPATPTPWVSDPQSPYVHFLEPDESLRTRCGKYSLAPLGTMAYVEVRHDDLPGNAPILRLPEYLRNREAYINANMVWTKKADGELHYRYAPDADELSRQRMAFEGTVRAVDDGVEVKVELWNPTDQPWPSEDYWIYELINRNSPAFFDPDGKRVVVWRKTGVSEGKFVSLFDLFNNQFAPSRNGGVTLATDPDRPGDRECSLPLIASISADQRWISAVAVDPPGNMGFNINPGTYGLVANVWWGQLQPGQRRTARLKFYYFAGSSDDLFNHFRKEIPISNSRS